MQALVQDPLGLVGKLLDRKYRVDARVAEGGFGAVYAGHHLGLGRPLAIKILQRAPGDSPGTWGELIAQFLEEARLVAQLRHPAVVSVLDAGITTTDQHPEGVPWIVMEWIDGETLTEDLARRRAHGLGGRTRAETLALLRPVVEAIAEAHDIGIVHRDLKPDNLMLTPGVRGPSVRVFDFGIAKVVQPEGLAPRGRTTTETTVRAFSPAYAAPEQLSGGRTGPWTDVHALALLFTEVLCGSRAAADDDVDLYYRTAFDPTRPTPATRGVDVGDWEPILSRALALRSQDRYASARELLAALDGIVPAEPAIAERGPGDPDQAVEPSAVRNGPQHNRKSSPRTRLVAGTVAVAVIAAVAWVGLAMRGGPATTAAPAAKASRSGEPGLAAGAARCTSNAACSRPGAPAICRPSVGCVTLRSQDCEPVADPRALDSDRTVWFGTLFPLTGPDAEAFGRRESNAIELARRDFAQVMSGASTAGAFDRARPIGLVMCDDAADFRRAATHLVDTVGVPAVIGFYKSAEVIDLATSLFVPRRVLAISSINSNPLITRVPHPEGVPRLIWRTTYLSTDAAAAVSAWLATELEPSLHAAGRFAGRALRVALIRPRDVAGAALSDAFARTLRFNGKPAIDNGVNYREITLEAEAPKASPEYAQLADELLAFAPHVVVYAANPAIAEALFVPLEAHWPHDAGHRPFYISIGLLTPELLAFIGADRDRRHRVFGVTSVGATPANIRLVTHYNETFTDRITRTIDPNGSYDAFYLLAYATYAIPGREQVTGERLSRAFRKLVPPGRPIEVGLAGIFDAYATLSRGESIDVTGATGKLDFDLATGDSAFDEAVLCAGLDERGNAVDGIESGLVYVAASKKLEGTMHCP